MYINIIILVLSAFFLLVSATSVHLIVANFSLFSFFHSHPLFLFTASTMFLISISFISSLLQDIPKRGSRDYTKIASMKMIDMVFKFAILLSFGLLVSANADVYTVIMEGEPVITYRGGVGGFAATASESGEKIDVTRY